MSYKDWDKLVSDAIPLKSIKDLPMNDKRRLPAWLKEQLNESIINCRLLAEELRDDDDIEASVQHERRANTLEWVLSLEEKE